MAKKQYSGKMDSALLEQLDKEAAKEKRSRNNMIEVIIERYFAELKSKKKKV